MFKKKYDLAIINRTFWPESEILGEAKLELAEKASEKGSSCIIAQSPVDVKTLARDKNRGQRVRFYISKSRSTSSSSIFKRVLDALVFGIFVVWTLLKARPRHVYVSTNPPVVIPFLVYLYGKIFNATYTYHIQDIHPEITNLVYPMNKLLFRLLRGLDNITLRSSKSLITLSEEMAQCIRYVSRTQTHIELIENPSFDVTSQLFCQPKIKDFIFCGNAGRVQEIPTLLSAISRYLDNGGNLKFEFAGSGVYKTDIARLAADYDNVTYHGFLRPSEANKLVSQHRWALLPINDEVTNYAFPSKSASYYSSGCKILGVCGSTTSVAKWIDSKRCGVHVPASVDDLVSVFFEIENDESCAPNIQQQRVQVTTSSFVESVWQHLQKIGL